MGRIDYSGIRFKATALASVLVLLAVIFTALMMFDGIARGLVAEEKQNLQNASHHAGIRLSSVLGKLQKDTLALAGSPTVGAYVQAGALADTNAAGNTVRHLSREQVTHVMIESLRTQPLYVDARIIGSADGGLEPVRVRRAGESIVTAIDDSRRFGSDAVLYADASALREGQVALSDLHLNRDQGKVTNPPRSVIRAITPLHDAAGRACGFVVLTADLTGFLGALRVETNVGSRFFIANDRGDFAVHPDPVRTFAFEFGRPYRLTDEFPDFASVFAPGAAMPGNASLDDATGKKLVLGVADVVAGRAGAQRRFRMIHAASYRSLVIAALDSWPMVLVGGLMAAAVTLPLAFLFAGALATPLRQICTAIATYTPGQPLGNLPVGRDDEIGLLARSFDRMVQTVENHRTHLATEIAERQQGIVALEHSEALGRNVIETMLDGHVISDSHGVICSFNRAAEAIFGYAAAEALGKSVALLMAAPYSDKHDGYVERYRSSRGPTNMLGARRQLPGQRRNGEIFPLEITVNAFQTGDGEFYGAVIRDLSETQARETKLQHLAAALDHAADSFHIIDRNGFMLYANPTWERLTGQRLVDVLGKRPSNKKLMDFRNEDLQNMIRTTQRGEAWSGTLRNKSADGGIFEHEVTISPVQDSTGQLTSFVVIGRDVTEKKALEAQLQRAQKLESIGQLAAGIAHEINTPTQYVGDNLRFVQDAFTEMNALLGRLTALSGGAVSAEALAEALAQALGSADLEFLREEIPRALEQSADGCQRISGIVKAMKEFSHPGQDKTPVDLNRAIASTITVASNEWKYVAEVKTDFDAALPPVVCLPGEFNQVILNMLVNAAHAIADVVGDGSQGKGTITVATRKLGEWAEIRIGDTGTGIGPEIRERIFDPFFTTKQVGKGTGQGLAIAHDVIVTKHGGSIALESEPGKGSTFIVRLPLMPDSSAAVRAA